MRLSRLGTALNWKRALGELILIVGGVLIALGLDSWWEDRQDRQRERAYIEQLLSEVRDIEEHTRETIASDSTIQARTSRLLDAAYNGPLPTADSLSLATGYAQFRPLTGTWSALVQSGDIQLLRRDSLRFNLISYAALIAATQALLAHTETLIWRSTERVILGRLIHSQPDPAERQRAASLWRGPDVRAVLGDPEIISAMEVQGAASANRVRNLHRLLEPTATLKRMLEAELGVR